MATEENTARFRILTLNCYRILNSLSNLLLRNPFMTGVSGHNLQLFSDRKTGQSSDQKRRAVSLPFLTGFSGRLKSKNILPGISTRLHFIIILSGFSARPLFPVPSQYPCLSSLSLPLLPSPAVPRHHSCPLHPLLFLLLMLLFIPVHSPICPDLSLYHGNVS